MDGAKTNSFHPFPKLPTELRFQIWRYVLPKARVLEFKPYEKKRDFTLLCYNLHPTLISRFEQEAFGVLPYINRDSRAFFLKNYRLCFDGILERPLYFDPKVDVVLFSNEQALMLFSDAINHLPSTELRASVAPVRKAAIRWIIRKYNATTVTPIALDYEGEEGMRYRNELRTLFERLPTLKEFAFCYLFRSIGEMFKRNMVHFVEGMEREMRERTQIAKENENKSIAASAGNIPSIVMLKCPTDRASRLRRCRRGLPNVRLLRHRNGMDEDWCIWTIESMELETRPWECSRDFEDFDPLHRYPL